MPANLLATLQSLIFAALHFYTGSRPSRLQVYGMVVVACLYAVALVLHVLSWFWIGVVMAPTYILLGLGVVCWGLNGWAVFHPRSLTWVERWLLLFWTDRVLPRLAV